MNPETETPVLDAFLTGLGLIWSPGMEAAKLQCEWNAHTLEETASAAERAGYQVCYADLPDKVSGFSDVVEGQSYIVLNRAKSRDDLEFTLPHELGHQVLHLKPSRRNCLSQAPGTNSEEFEANLFATTWVMWAGNEKQRQELVRENREAAATIISSCLQTIFLVVVAVIVCIGSKPFPAQYPGLTDRR